jgi:hypothetical protein
MNETREIMYLTAEKFTELWQKARSLKEFSELTGISRRSASVRAAEYRKRGVPLKRFRHSEHMDWERVAEVARKFEDVE